MKEKMLELRSQGKTYSEIAKELGCAISTVCYYIADGQKSKSTKRSFAFRKKNPLIHKVKMFKNRFLKDAQKLKPIYKTKRLLQLKIYTFIHKGPQLMKENFTADDVIKKIGQNPVCYLTGKPIDINSPRTYQFDHIIPFSRGGESTLENLGICTKQANSAKSDMTPEELIDFCKSVLIHNGFNIEKR